MFAGTPMPDGSSDMGRVDRQSPGDDQLRCSSCGDVIGVYEPLVHVLGGVARPTSRAAEPELAYSSGQHFHLDCYEGPGPDR